MYFMTMGECNGKKVRQHHIGNLFTDTIQYTLKTRKSKSYNMMVYNQVYDETLLRKNFFHTFVSPTSLNHGSAK